MSIILKLNFDIKSSSQEKFDTESLINVEKLMSLNMSNDLSLNSAEKMLMLNLEQMIIYMLFFLKSETSEASYFNETNVMKFLH